MFVLQPQPIILLSNHVPSRKFDCPVPWKNRWAQQISVREQQREAAQKLLSHFCEIIIPQSW